MFKSKGFTLVEVLLVIIIIGILAAVVIPRITYSRATAQQEACKANVAAMSAQIELYYLQVGKYPGALSEMAPEYMDAVPICPVNNSTNYVYTSLTGRITKPHAHP